jgi:hypothetical protein
LILHEEKAKPSMEEVVSKYSALSAPYPPHDHGHPYFLSR